MGAEPAHGAFGILNLSRKSVPRVQTITDRDGDITLPGQKSGEGAMDFVRTFGPTAAVQDDHGGKRAAARWGREGGGAQTPRRRLGRGPGGAPGGGRVWRGGVRLPARPGGP